MGGAGLGNASVNEWDIAQRISRLRSIVKEKRKALERREELLKKHVRDRRTPGDHRGGRHGRHGPKEGSTGRTLDPCGRSQLLESRHPTLDSISVNFDRTRESDYRNLFDETRSPKHRCFTLPLEGRDLEKAPRPVPTLQGPYQGPWVTWAFHSTQIVWRRATKTDPLRHESDSTVWVEEERFPITGCRCTRRTDALGPTRHGEQRSL